MDEAVKMQFWNMIIKFRAGLCLAQLRRHTVGRSVWVRFMDQAACLAKTRSSNHSFEGALGSRGGLEGWQQPLDSPHVHSQVCQKPSSRRLN